jgi:hypothetical protein
MGERDELVELLGRNRFFLRNTLRDLNDEQAARRTTVSELTLGGLIKHVAGVEERWVAFILDGPSAMGGGPDDPATAQAWVDGFRMLDGETVAGLLARYEQVAEATDALIGTVDLDAVQPLPARPWFPPGTTWSARRVLLHVIAETAQHAGHADIIRESLDGAKSMG